LELSPANLLEPVVTALMCPESGAAGLGELESAYIAGCTLGTGCAPLINKQCIAIDIRA